jgi:hypothetical protein
MECSIFGYKFISVSEESAGSIFSIEGQAKQ